jgi:hypothetical protein
LGSHRAGRGGENENGRGGEKFDLGTHLTISVLLLEAPLASHPYPRSDRGVGVKQAKLFLSLREIFASWMRGSTGQRPLRTRKDHDRGSMTAVRDKADVDPIHFSGL